MMSKDECFYLYDLPKAGFDAISWPGRIEPFGEVAQRWTATEYMPWLPVAHVWRCLVARAVRESGAGFQTRVMLHYRIEGLMTLEAAAFWRGAPDRIGCLASAPLAQMLEDTTAGEPPGALLLPYCKVFAWDG